MQWAINIMNTGGIHLQLMWGMDHMLLASLLYPMVNIWDAQWSNGYNILDDVAERNRN